jgi:hypothetical protein
MAVTADLAKLLGKAHEDKSLVEVFDLADLAGGLARGLAGLAE